MSLHCHECGSSSLRRANLRFFDAMRLLALQYPVRCRECKCRWYVAYKDARLLPHAPHRRHPAEKVF
jgi:hypothetical protein